MATKTMPPRINGKAPNGVSDKAKRQADETLKQLIDERNNIRFSDIPSQINIPVYGIGSEEAQDVELDLMELMDDPTELCTLLENEKANRSTWVTTALAYVKQKKLDVAVEILTTGMAAADREQKPQDKITLIGALCWIYLAKMRDAPRIAPDGTAPGEVKTKEHYLRLVTQQLNEGTKLDASYAPLHMARGTLCVLRASLLAPVKTPGSTIDPQKVEILRQALGAFNNCIKTSNQKNMFAFMGKARVLYALGNYEEALANYQVVLAKLPQCINPDPRIGIGACLWMLGHKEEAKKAWERALVLNSDSVSANMLLALYNLQISSHLSSTSKEFLELYKKAMTEYTQKAYKIDKKNALANSTFAPFFLGKKPEDAAKLAKNAIHNTDVNAIASDSWYTLAKKEHYDGNLEKALEYYKRSDDARGGENRGYLPAKFGLAQISAMKNDLGEAKFRLEKILQLSKSNVAAQTLLGTVYADEVARSQYSTPVEDKSAEMKKAVTLLEAVRASWKSKIKTVKPDPAVLLNLARLYEIDHPDKSLICLQQIAQLQYEALAEKPATPEEEQQVKQEILKSLPPQVLNNMGALFYKSERFVEAKDHFQFALDSCIAAEKRGETMDIDALLTTISYNLGRALEAGGLTDDAITVYNGVLQRHSDYVDARLRLAYISLKRSPGSEGPRAVSKLHQEFGANLEVRALYGWYLGKVQQRQKISADKINENPEFRLYKHTLQNYDKHDRYALIGMGNIYLQTAREMPRQTDSEKAKRSTYYSKACEFFEKALQLDSRNAYAAQGVAIALIEDRKDYKNALTILSQVRETLKESIVFVNLGHLFAELRNWNKSIESYEYALEKSGGKDVTVIACLGRTWLNRGRHEKKLECYKNALMYAEKVHFNPPIIQPFTNHF